eukprot:2024317-Rhodomonas_salina.2
MQHLVAGGLVLLQQPRAEGQVPRGLPVHVRDLHLVRRRQGHVLHEPRAHVRQLHPGLSAPETTPVSESLSALR